jgi:hypothetical protein
MVGTLRFAHPTQCYSQRQSGNTDLFHIKSQSNNLTSRGILFPAVILALRLTTRPKKIREHRPTSGRAASA